MAAMAVLVEVEVELTVWAALLQARRAQVALAQPVVLAEFPLVQALLISLLLGWQVAEQAVVWVHLRLRWAALAAQVR
jgi:hypothetical protein